MSSSTRCRALVPTGVWICVGRAGEAQALAQDADGRA